jgi:uncharacterized protein (TIGR02284 family)
MAEERDEVVSTLNNLIETCKDGEEGYRWAADKIEDSELKSLFNRYAQQRAQFASELRTEVQRLGGDPEDSGSAGGALHRGWINIKSAVTGGDREAIISECERGEDVAVESYQKAMDEGLPSNLQSVVQQQYSQVKEAHNSIRSLERASED